jgi:DNA-binding MarR family transcriptional regulator
MDLRPEDSLGFQVRRCHRAFDRLLNLQLGRYGLTSGFWYFLRALWRENGATQRRLADLISVTEPTAVSTLAAMVGAGLVERRRDQLDRRKLRVLLTPKGEQLKDELMPEAIRINAVAAAGIPQEEIEICLRVLGRMSQNLADQSASAGVPTGLLERGPI